MPSREEELGVALTWFLVARAMLSARGQEFADVGSAAGLYGQAVLGLSESVCLEAKSPERIGSLTLVDCLSRLKHIAPDTREKIVIGAMMVAFDDGRMAPLEIRWASMLASASGMTSDGFQQCCSAARVMASMMQPKAAGSSA